MALVIGNSAYATVTPLPNPANDAADVAVALERLGFEVTRVNDVDRVGLCGMRETSAAEAPPRPCRWSFMPVTAWRWMVRTI